MQRRWPELELGHRFRPAGGHRALQIFSFWPAPGAGDVLRVEHGLELCNLHLVLSIFDRVAWLFWSSLRNAGGGGALQIRKFWPQRGARDAFRIRHGLELILSFLGVFLLVSSLGPSFGLAWGCCALEVRCFWPLTVARDLMSSCNLH